MANPIVIYHASCSDGFCAAWLFHRAFPNAEFIAATYGNDPPDLQLGRPVYIVDFSYPRKVMEQMAAMTDPCELVVLDHHKTARDACEGLDFCTFDMDKSGGRLAWEYLWTNDLLRSFGHTVQNGVPTCMTPHWLVAYTEDRDLWRFELEHSKVINAAIRSYPFDFGAWDEMAYRNAFDLQVEGEAIERYRLQIVESHVLHAREVDLAGHRILAVPCTNGEIISEVAGELAKDRPFGACYFDTDEGYRVWSLRSRDDGVDVSVIAKSFGGGGHRNAAGFRMPI